METNHLNNPGSQPKDTPFPETSYKLKPQFEDLGKPEIYINHFSDLKEKIITESKNTLFDSRSANDWLRYAKERPTPRMLFDEFWFEFETCILFADTNAGKSILAVQIGDSISKGVPIVGFRLEAGKQPVHYFDFELSAKQFELRYSIKNESSHTLENHYLFDPGFHRIELSMESVIPNGVTYEQFICDSLEQYVIEFSAKILIIDNVTYLSSETEKGKDAQTLMKHLKKLKEKYSLSVLVLAHTPKRYPSRPITKNDLQGSRMMMNFADSSFAIGKSCIRPEIKYMKQIKVRNSSFQFEYDNVPTFQISKSYNFLQFDFLGFETENDHLKQPEESNKKDIIEEVKKLSLCGLSQRAIAEELHLGLGTVNKYLKS